MNNRYCGNCNKTDGLCYTSDPPKVKCTITGEFHRYNDECNCNKQLINPNYNCIILSNSNGIELIRIDLSTGVLTVSNEMKNCQVEDISRQILEILDKSCIWIEKGTTNYGDKNID